MDYKQSRDEYARLIGELELEQDKDKALLGEIKTILANNDIEVDNLTLDELKDRLEGLNLTPHATHMGIDIGDVVKNEIKFNTIGGSLDSDQIFIFGENKIYKKIFKIINMAADKYVIKCDIEGPTYFDEPSNILFFQNKIFFHDRRYSTSYCLNLDTQTFEKLEINGVKNISHFGLVVNNLGQVCNDNILITSIDDSLEKYHHYNINTGVTTIINYDGWHDAYNEYLWLVRSESFDIFIGKGTFGHRLLMVGNRNTSVVEQVDGVRFDNLNGIHYVILNNKLYIVFGKSFTRSIDLLSTDGLYYKSVISDRLESNARVYNGHIFNCSRIEDITGTYKLPKVLKNPIKVF